ncbi:MAG: hypothetical protein HGA85_05915 [Nanoarchaeota archaeon]|nr:hypothetical protein [Nanoarchaeota archaeon]
MVSLIQTENTDLVKDPTRLTVSMFDEVFNYWLEKWYAELGISGSVTEKYLYVDEGRLMFDSAVHAKLTHPGNIFTQILRSAKVAKALTDAFSQYDPKQYDIYYQLNIVKKASKELDAKGFEDDWEKLIECFRYAVLAGLLVQYRLSGLVKKELCEDLAAARYNSLLDFHEKKITKTEFDMHYGFYSEKDYEFACPRYSEVSSLTCPIARMEPNRSYANIRDHAKSRVIKMVALLRHRLLGTDDPGIFNRSKEELLGMANKEKAEAKVSSSSQSCKGVRLSGKGVVTAKACIVRSEEDYRKVSKGDIIVTDILSPNLVVLFPLIRGIVAETGSSMSHAAIVARERDLPVLGQVKDAVKLVESHDTITVDFDECKLVLD